MAFRRTRRQLVVMPGESSMTCCRYSALRFLPFASGAWLMVLALALTAMPKICRAAPSQENNLLVNGDLSKQGQASLPLGWKASALPGCGSRFDWRGDQTAPAEVEISNSEPNEARLTQAVNLEAGAYRLGAEVRTQEVSNHSGAYLSIGPENSALSLTTSPVRGSRNWRRVELLFRTASERRGIVVGCRLGLPNLPATGTAFFRGLSLVRLRDPSNPSIYQDIDRLWQIDLQAKSLGPGTAAWGAAHSMLGLWGVAGFFGLLIMLALLGWRLLAETAISPRE